MPQTKLENLFFMTLTVLLSVFSFASYNIAINFGAMSNKVFLLALQEIPILFPIAFLIELFIASKISMLLTSKIVNFKTDKEFVIILAITCTTIFVMCPAMTFISTIMYNGFTIEFMANWFTKIIFNMPFAFFVQLFFIGPIVRLIFRSLFRNKQASSID